MENDIIVPFKLLDCGIIILLGLLLELVTLRKNIPFSPLGSIFLVGVVYAAHRFTISAANHFELPIMTASPTIGVLCLIVLYYFKKRPLSNENSVTAKA